MCIQTTNPPLTIFHCLGLGFGLMHRPIRAVGRSWLPISWFRQLRIRSPVGQAFRSNASRPRVPSRPAYPWRRSRRRTPRRRRYSGRQNAAPPDPARVPLGDMLRQLPEAARMRGGGDGQAARVQNLPSGVQIWPARGPCGAVSQTAVSARLRRLPVRREERPQEWGVPSGPGRLRVRATAS